MQAANTLLHSFETQSMHSLAGCAYLLLVGAPTSRLTKTVICALTTAMAALRETATEGYKDVAPRRHRKVFRALCDVFVFVLAEPELRKAYERDIKSGCKSALVCLESAVVKEGGDAPTTAAIAAAAARNRNAEDDGGDLCEDLDRLYCLEVRVCERRRQLPTSASTLTP